ncbi:MAG: hypothetical protein ACFFCS_16440 [Candidatus Hodarchaeota archaeon]
MADFLIASREIYFLWGMVVSILCVCGIHYIYRSYKLDDLNEKLVLFGFGCLFFGMAIMRLFFFVGEVVIEGTYIGHNFYGNYNNLHFMYKIFIKSGYIGGIAGYTILIFAAEKIIQKTKYIFSVLNGLLVAIIVVFPFDIAKISCYVAVLIDVIISFVVLFLFARKSRIKFQAVSMFLVAGFLVAIAGHIIDSTVVKEIGQIPLIIAPILFILGSIISIIPTIINPRLFSRALVYWLGVSVVFILIFILGISFLANMKIINIFSFIIIIGILVVSIVLAYSIYRTISLLKTQNVPKKEEETRDVLEIFTKRQRVTEEEVSYHREQKICLVCKTKVSRITYICPECDALYCSKCSDALSDLENACWACYAPFDPNKPVKIEKREDDEESKLEMKV